MPAAGVEIRESVAIWSRKGKEESRLWSPTGPVTYLRSQQGVLRSGTLCGWRAIKLIGNSAWQGPGLSDARDSPVGCEPFTTAYRDMTSSFLLWDRYLRVDRHQDRHQ